MGCTTSPEVQSSRPRSCKRCCHPSPPEPTAGEHGRDDVIPRVSTRWRWNGQQGRRVVRDAYADRAAVVRRVVNPVGNAYAAGVGAEVVIVHRNRRVIPFGASVLEVADQFALLTVDADDGKALALEALLQARKYSGIADPGTDWSWWRSASG